MRTDILRVTRLNDNLEVFRVELISSSKFDCKALNDHLLAEGKLWVRAQFQQDVLRKEVVSNAPKDLVFLLIGKFLQ